MERRWKQYFEFSRRERVAVVLLILVIIALWIIPLFFKSNHIMPGDISVLPLSESLIPRDSNEVVSQGHGESQGANKYRNNKEYQYDSTGNENRLFYFDPNRTDAETWKKLGVKDRQVKTILNYISKGGRFREAEDIRKIYGLSELEAGRLMPFVRIQRVDRPSLKYREEDKRTKEKEKFVIKKEKEKEKPVIKRVIEINSATVEDLEALPGIGPVLSRRILGFREKLGGFYSVEQLGETYGLVDSIYQKVRPLIRCDNSQVKRIRINDSDDSLVFSHPYFRGKLARLISVYRSEHGAFNHPEELRKLPLVDENLYNRILPYVDLVREAKNPL